MSWLPRKKVLVPVDFSPDAARAVSTALEIAETPSDIYLLHVLLPLDTVSPGVAWGEVTDDRRERAIRENFNRFLEEHNAADVNVDVRFGNPGLEIADYAEEIAADLIVIPSHGYHGLKRLLLGSVTERVLRHAPCSVLVLRRSDAD